MKTLETLLQSIQAKTWSEEDRELAARITADLTALTARQLAGEDVSAEFPHLKAQTMNLSAGAAQEFALEFRLWATAIIGEAIGLAT